MTTSTSPMAGWFSPERILLVLPIVMGAGLAVLMLTAGATPLMVQLKADQEVVDEMLRKREGLAAARQQLEQELAELERLGQKHKRLVNLVAGEGQLRTVLAQLNLLTQRQNVRITAMELQPVVRFTPPPPPPPSEAEKSADPSEPPSAEQTSADPLLLTGLEKRSALISLEGRFLDLLAVLRELEQLEVIVLMDDLALLNSGANGAQTQLSISISAYGRS